MTRSAAGVVDFIDVGLRDSRWPTFNIADMAVDIMATKSLLYRVAWDLSQSQDRKRAHAMASVVMTIGRKRVEPALMRASFRPRPSRRAWNEALKIGRAHV